MRTLRLALPGLALGAYALFSLWSLSWFPFVHTDEVWLASLTRSMVSERSLAATESFFRLTPRYPHAIKTLWHLLQMPFVAVSFSHVAARLPSAIAGLLGVAAVWGILKRLGVSSVLAAAGAAALAIDIQYLYISHLARQEAVVVGAMLAAILLIVHTRRSWQAALVVGALTVVHPNALIAALAVAPWVLLTRRPLRELAIAVAIVCAAGVAAIGASLVMDPDFLPHYRAFGDAVGVGDSPLRRLLNLRRFGETLLTQRAGTYYLPPIAPQLWLVATLMPAAGIAALAEIWRGSAERVAAGCTTEQARANESLVTPVTPPTVSGLPAASALLVVFGLVAIGKYSPPSAVLLLPWLYLAVPLVCTALFRSERVRRRVGIATMGVLIAILVGQLTVELPRWRPGPDGRGDFARLSRAISGAIEKAEQAERAEANATRPGEGTILAGLGAGFAVPHDRLMALHDLAALSGSLEAALRAQNVTVAILPREELDLIWQNRPVWNDVYGNPVHFYPELRAILEQYGTFVTAIPASVYGMRLISALPPEAPLTVDATMDVWRIDFSDQAVQ